MSNPGRHVSQKWTKSGLVSGTRSAKYVPPLPSVLRASNRLSVVHRPSVDFDRRGSTNFRVCVHFAVALLQFFDELSLLAGYDRKLNQGGGSRQNGIGSFSA